MKRLAILVLALASQATAFGAPPVAVRQSFGEHLDVNVVDVEVYVTDADGHPVRDLQRGDFTLLEDGKPMQINSFQAVDRTPPSPRAAPGGGAAPEVRTAAAADPLHLVVFIDNTHVMPAHRNRALRQIRDFLTLHLSAGDPVMLATWDPGLHVRLPFTTDREALGRALEAQEKVSAMSGVATTRRFALLQIQEIQDVAHSMQKGESHAQRGAGKRGDPDSSPDPRQAELDSDCPPEIADPVRDYAEQTRREVLGSIGGLTALVNSLSGLPSRKALLHVSDGVPATPGEDLFQVLYALCKEAETSATLVYRGTQALLDAQTYSVVKQWNDAAAHASAQRVTLYTLQASGLEGGGTSAADLAPNENIFLNSGVDRLERENRRASLTALASGTGGRAVLDANDLGADLARIDDDLDHYYSLGYTPPHAGDGRDHTIEVKVRRSGVHVRHRQIYRDKRPLEQVVDRTLASLYYGYEDNPLEIQVEIGDTAPVDKGTWSVPVRLRIPLFRVAMLPAEKSFEGKLRLLVAVNDPAGNQSPLRQVQVPISIPRDKALTALGQYYLYEVKLTLGPGEQHLAIAVRDEASTTTSYIARSLNVGPGKPAATR